MHRWETMLTVSCRRLCRGATQLDDALAVARRELLYALILEKARFVTYLYWRVRASPDLETGWHHSQGYTMPTPRIRN